MSSYPRVVAAWSAAGGVQTVDFKDQQFGTVGKVVFQVVTAGGYDGTIRVYRRIQGAERSPVSVPWVRSAYFNETGQAAVNNTTDISAANVYSIWCDGTDVRLEQQSGGTTGTVTILAHGVLG